MRYLRLLGVQLRASLQVTMQYRVDFLVGALHGHLLDVVWNLVPMFVFWAQRPTIAGWTLAGGAAGDGLVHASCARVLDGAVQPSLLAVVEHIRKGTLDFVLLKPADAQFLVSTAKFEVVQTSSTRSAAVALAV